MPEDVTLTRRRRMLAFLVEQGGSGSLADANAFSEGKLLAAHQAFSAIMEGIVDGGFATWDGTTFTVTDAGRAEAALAPQARRRRSAAPASSIDTASDAGIAPAAEPAAEPTPEPAPAAGDSHAHAHPDTPSHDSSLAHGDNASHDHDHAHAGGHSHAHGHAGRSDPPLESSPRASPRPQASPPRTGVRARILGFVRGLLRGR